MPSTPSGNIKTSNRNNDSNSVSSKAHRILLAPVRLVSKVCCATSSSSSSYSYGGGAKKGQLIVGKGGKPSKLVDHAHQKRPRRGSKTNKIGDAETGQQGLHHQSDIALAAAAAAAAAESDDEVEAATFDSTSLSTSHTHLTSSTASLPATSTSTAASSNSSSTITNSNSNSNSNNTMKKKLFQSKKDKDSKSFLHRVQTKLLSSTQNLTNKKLDSTQKSRLQNFGLFIYECMTTNGRKYHSIAHVFDVLDPHSNDDLLDIATLFHDVVYYTIDGGLSEQQHQVLDDLIESQTPTTLILKRSTLQKNILLAIITDLFGYEPEKSISPMQGSNEFLSAVCAAVLLREVLNVEQIVQIAACIEATIPFRPTTPQEGGPMDRLHKRLRSVNTKYSLFLSMDEINAAIRRATILAYWDLRNFSFSHPAAFLDNTWALLPETNPTLRGNSYTFSEYQHAMLKMHRFFGFLQAPQVFVKFQNTPSNYAELEQATARNLNMGKSYIGCKLVASSILVALADMTAGVGADSPSNLLLNLHKSKDWTPRSSQEHQYDAEVYRTIYNGRSKETWFDIPQSYLAAYLYKTLGASTITDLASQYCAENPLMKGKELLQAIPQDILSQVVHHLIQSDPPRSKSLEVDTKHLWC
mmetsp:Transcript_12218/g.18916  ORF Transcript_12218/g.18916 Transcript_12218/m.18916 type:complete len:640 (+) Transcript_12218:323-2242(+)